MKDRAISFAVQNPRIVFMVVLVALMLTFGAVGEVAAGHVDGCETAVDNVGSDYDCSQHDGLHP